MLKKWFWKILTLVFISFLVINPELMALAVFIDAIGLEMFLMLLEVQLIAVFGYYFNTWLKPLFLPIYHKLQRVDPYFFIPTYRHVKSCPALLCHAVPGFMLCVLGSLALHQETGMT